MKKRMSSSLFVIFALFCCSAVAQLVPEPNTYGTAAEVAISIPDWQFNPDASATTYTSSNGKYVTSPFGSLFAAVQLPAGASITRVEAQVCDTNASVGAVLNLADLNASGGGQVVAQVFIAANSGWVCP